MTIFSKDNTLMLIKIYFQIFVTKIANTEEVMSKTFNVWNILYYDIITHNVSTSNNWGEFIIVKPDRPTKLFYKVGKDFPSSSHIFGTPRVEVPATRAWYDELSKYLVISSI